MSIVSHSAINFSMNSMYHARIKCIDVSYYWIHEQMENESLHLKTIHTSENPTDMLTKVMSKDNFKLCKELVGMSYL